MAVIAGASDGPVNLAFGIDAFGQLALGALVEHDDDMADHFQMAQLFGCDVEQEVFAAGIVLGQGLGKVAACRRQFTLGPAELFQHQVGETGIGFTDAHGVLQSLIVSKHSLTPRRNHTARRSQDHPGCSAGCE